MTKYSHTFSPEKCAKCGAISEETYHGMLPDRGLIVILDGYENGFYDNYIFEPIKLFFCHECSIELWSSIPVISGIRGLHGLGIDEDHCCNYSYDFDDEGSVRFGDGTCPPKSNHIVVQVDKY